MIGTYDTVAPTPAMLETVARIVAWRTSSAGVDPQGSVRLTSAGSTRFAAGTVVTLPTVLGHREGSIDEHERRIIERAFRLDETRAARQPKLRWKPEDSAVREAAE